MAIFFQHISDPALAENAIRRRRYGMIQIGGGQFDHITFRLWPKLVSGIEATRWDRHRGGRSALPDRCRLYYAQPWSAPDFLALNYVCSTSGTTLATFRMALRMLDHVARVKGSDAIVCEAFNVKISDRLFRRWGWEQHLLASRRRHWIKRFYGDWSSVPPLAEILGEQFPRNEQRIPADPLPASLVSLAPAVSLPPTVSLLPDPDDESVLSRRYEWSGF